MCKNLPDYTDLGKYCAKIPGEMGGRDRRTLTTAALLGENHHKGSIDLNELLTCVVLQV